MARYEFQLHEGSEAFGGYILPILDLHERPLVPARLVQPDAEGVTRVFKRGEIFDVHERREAHLHEFVRSCRDFRVVNSGNHPELYT